MILTHIRLNEFAKRYLVSGVGDGTLGSRICSELEKLGGTIGEARVAMTNAVSNTTLPGAQGTDF